MVDAEEEYYLDNDRLRRFIERVKRTADEHEEVPSLLSALHEPFEELLEEDDWLPELYRDLPPEDYDNKSEMGGEIAQWLLYRQEGKLSLSSLVVPPGVETPVHDHLAWGLVGLCQGTQEETFFRRVDSSGHDEGEAELELVERQQAGPGDFYELIPPEGDIHSVKTTSEVPSVSLHLLGADIGCIPRHAFDPDADLVKLFQSGYTNVECDDALEGDANAHTHDQLH
ncbi:cysteine dioxygenase family protein [Natronorarus salvus]|uniref:cysteine dioxygenase family protein n=1 Tax=Natronorarus salvus TaxID=3117733 RepID=UPI002F26D913